MVPTLFLCDAEKPAPFLDVQLYFNEPPNAVGYWTGHEWLATGCVVEPVQWSPIHGVGTIRTNPVRK